MFTFTGSITSFGGEHKKTRGGRVFLGSNSQWCMKTFQSDKICQHCRGYACKHHEYKTHNTQYFATVIISACGKPLKSTRNPCHFNEFAEKFYYVVYIYLLVWYRITKHLLLIFHFVTCSFFKLWIRSTSEEARDRKRRKTEERKKEHCS